MQYLAPGTDPVVIGVFVLGQLCLDSGDCLEPALEPKQSLGDQGSQTGTVNDCCQVHTTDIFTEQDEALKETLTKARSFLLMSLRVTKTAYF